MRSNLKCPLSGKWTLESVEVFFHLPGIPKGACGGVFIAENTMRCFPHFLHLNRTRLPIEMGALLLSGWCRNVRRIRWLRLRKLVIVLHFLLEAV